MKKILITIFFILFENSLNIVGQTYSERVIHQDLGMWMKSSGSDILRIDSYITKQKILKYDNAYFRRRTSATLPRYRYELFVKSNSIKNGDSTKVWLFNTEIFINNICVTERQFPEGFNVVVDVEPTKVYWYESNNESIHIELMWKKLKYFVEE